jgi:hypothetical protein
MAIVNTEIKAVVFLCLVSASLSSMESCTFRLKKPFNIVVKVVARVLKKSNNKIRYTKVTPDLKYAEKWLA